MVLRILSKSISLVFDTKWLAAFSAFFKSCSALMDHVMVEIDTVFSSQEISTITIEICMKTIGTRNILSGVITYPANVLSNHLMKFHKHTAAGYRLSAFPTSGINQLRYQDPPLINIDKKEIPNMKAAVAYCLFPCLVRPDLLPHKCTHFFMGIRHEYVHLIPNH